MAEAGRPQGYQESVVWQRAMDLVTDVFRVSRVWPKEEIFGLAAQIRRAAVSVPSNIAEGHGRFGPKEYLHHASIACGSLSEFETQILIAHRLGYIEAANVGLLLGCVSDVRRLLLGLIRRLRAA